MLYGDELFLFDAEAEGGSPVAIGATGAIYTRKLKKPIVVRAFGFLVTTLFNYDTLTAKGILTLYRYAKCIKTIAVGNSGGTGYAVGDQFSVTQTGASGGIGVVTSVTAGVVTGVAVRPLAQGILPPDAEGVNYSAASNLATVALTGAGSGLTVTISDKVALATLTLENAIAAGRVVVTDVPNLVVNEVPTRQGLGHFNMGDVIAIEVSTQATGGTYIAGAFQPFISYHNRGDSYGGQPQVINQTPVPEVTGSYGNVG
jgi:hypothetical protein